MCSWTTTTPKKCASSPFPTPSSNASADTFERYFGGLRKLIVSEGTWNIGISVVSTAVNCGLFLYIARKVYDGILKVGDYSLYTGALSSISNGVSTLISTTATIYEGTLFIDNMIVFMNEEPTIVPLIPDDVLHVKRHVGHTIEFRDVSFRYPGTERMIIKHMNLYLAAGETAVLVGLNGAGKTTLIKLMTRLYDRPRVLSSSTARTSADTTFTSFTICSESYFRISESTPFPSATTLRSGRFPRKLTKTKSRDAAKQSSADAFIDKLPKDYDTPLMRYFDDDGIELSIGQWQKLSIARAFYSDSDVLILDEPTASLDPMAEQDIFNQFDRLREDKTTIFVSHRLSSATVASKIIVLEDGMIVEEGNPPRAYGKARQILRAVLHSGNAVCDGRSRARPMLKSAERNVRLSRDIKGSSRTVIITATTMKQAEMPVSCTADVAVRTQARDRRGTSRSPAVMQTAQMSCAFPPAVFQRSICVRRGSTGARRKIRT